METIETTVELSTVFSCLKVYLIYNINMLKPYTPTKYQKEKKKYVKILIKRDSYRRIKIASAKSGKPIVTMIDELSRIKV